MAEKRLTNKQRYWLRHLEAWSKTSESLSDYARRANLKAQTLYVAKGRLVAQGLWSTPGDVELGRAPRFVRVKAPTGTPAAASCQVHLPNGARVDVSLHDTAFEVVLRSVAAL